MRSLKRFTALTLSFVMTFMAVNCSPVDAATAKGTTLRLEATEGTVTLKNSQGTAKSIKDGMKLYNGDTATTAASSYAYISIDSSKAVKVEENSAVSIKQSGTQNEVMISEGSLLFNVTVPLKKTESLNIRTSTMVTGVRGTIGVGKRISDDESVLYLLEGHTEVVSIDRKTRELKLVPVSAGQCAIIRRDDEKSTDDDQIIEATITTIKEEDLDDFVVIEIGRNLDVQKRLREDDVFDVDKILGLYEKLGDDGTYITIGEAVTPNSVSGNKGVSINTVTPNAVSSNKTDDGSGVGGGGGGGGGGGNSGGGSSAPANNNNNNNNNAAEVSGNAVSDNTVSTNTVTGNTVKLQNKTVMSAPAVAANNVTGFSQIIVPEVTTCKLDGSEDFSDAIPAGDTVEYAVSLTEEAPVDDDKWQVDNTFTGLEPNTTYYFFSRIKATETTEASQPSAAVAMTTKGAEPVVVSNEAGDIYYQFKTGNSTVSPNAVTALCGSPLSFYNANLGNIVNQPDPSDYSAGLTIPATVTYCGEEVPVTAVMGAGFNSSNGTIASITIPDTVETIGEFAFNGAVVTGEVTIGKNVKDIDRMAFQNSGMTSVKFMGGVETIGEGAFEGCANLASVEFMGGVETIGEDAFKGCTTITSVDIPEGLKNIGAGAFQGCSSLRKVYLPAGVENIETDGGTKSPFLNCYQDPGAEYERFTIIWEDKIPNANSFEEKCFKINDAENGGDLNATMLYYKETEGDTVELYSPQCEFSAYDAATAQYGNFGDCSTLDNMQYQGRYSAYIDLYYLNWALGKYTNVVIPKDNIAILNNKGVDFTGAFLNRDSSMELEIPAGKTLAINGELSTTDGFYSQQSSFYPRESSGGIIVNDGSLIVGSTGSLFTSDSNIHNGLGMYRSGTISSNGKVDVDGKLVIFDSGAIYEPNVTNGDVCFNVADMKLDTTGGVVIYDCPAQYDYINYEFNLSNLGFDYSAVDAYSKKLTAVSEAKNFKIVAVITQHSQNSQNYDLAYDCYMPVDAVDKSFSFYTES